MTRQTAFNLQPYAPVYAHTAVQVVNAAASQTIGVRRAVVDSVGNIRLARYVPVTSEKVIVTTPKNDVVGYAYMADKERHIVYEVGGAVHPNYGGQGIGTRLLEWAEQRVSLLSDSVAVGVKTVLQTNLYETESEAIQLFSQNGYTKVREWLHLVIELDAPPLLPTLPGSLYLREMDLENDWGIVGQLWRKPLLIIGVQSRCQPLRHCLWKRRKCQPTMHLKTKPTRIRRGFVLF